MGSYGFTLRGNIPSFPTPSLSVKLMFPSRRRCGLLYRSQQNPAERNSLCVHERGGFLFHNGL